MPRLAYSLCADLALALHAGYFLFVVLGMALIVEGGFLRWRWVRDLRFRAAHAAAVMIVVGLQHAGRPCPLTLAEDRLRARAGEAVYQAGFIPDWDRQLFGLSWDAPSVARSCDALLVLALVALAALPPDLPRRKSA